MDSVKLYSLSYRDLRTYYIAGIFAIGNILLPQFCHLFNLGGPIFLPIYFFTLIAAYKYGMTAGIITAIASPLANSFLFGMPPAIILPGIIIKSLLLAIGASAASKFAGKISLIAILLTILFYQVFGSVIDSLIYQNSELLFNDFRIGYPGLLLQLFGGALVLKTIEKI